MPGLQAPVWHYHVNHYHQRQIGRAAFRQVARLVHALRPTRIGACAQNIVPLARLAGPA